MLSEGFYLDQATSQLRQIVATAARSNVRLYAIDARGLDRTPEGSALTSISPLETGNHISTTAYDTIGDGTNSLAVDTGGFVVRNTNAFEEALAEIANDTSHYYVIGYSPTDATMDGAFRQITVRVKRQGVKVRARKGYLATADAVPAATMVASETSAVPAAESAGAAPAAAPAPAESAPTEPAPAPAPETPAAPASTAATAPVPTTPATAAPAPAPAAGAPGVTLRPDAAARVRKLAGGEEESGEGKDLASQGWDRYGRGDLEGAEKLLGQAARLPGAAPWVSYALGFAQLGLNRPEAAVRSWVRVRTAAPEFESVYFDLADAYTRLHDPDRAVAVLRLAEARWPKDAEVLNAIGTIQVRRGALDAALKSFQKAADTRAGRRPGAPQPGPHLRAALLPDAPLLQRGGALVRQPGRHEAGAGGVSGLPEDRRPLRGPGARGHRAAAMGGGDQVNAERRAGPRASTLEPRPVCSAPSGRVYWRQEGPSPEVPPSRFFRVISPPS